MFFRSKKKISVIIPSRSQSLQTQFLTTAINSINLQSKVDDYIVEVIICVDKGQEALRLKQDGLQIRYAESKRKSQSAALNAGIDIVDADFISFLEDDDTWNSNYLSCTLNALAQSKAGFISSTQLERDENNSVIRINDFPTPSGWLMTKKTLAKVGKFSEEYKFHLDNEWLGRLSESRTQRIHLVESTAPTLPGPIQQIRPWLNNVLVQSGGFVKIVRHEDPYPLVNRLVHSRSGMAKIAADPALKLISLEENKKLFGRFKRIPW